MKTSLESLIAGLNELREFLEYHEGMDSYRDWIETNVLTDSQKDQAARKFPLFSVNQTLKKRYNFSLVVVTLYALLERYVESLIEALVDRLNSLVEDFEDLPASIKDKHTALSIEYMQNRHDEGADSLTDKELISRIHSCLTGVSGYRLNSCAFRHHRSNLRIESISELLAKVGIEKHLERVVKSKTFVGYLKSIGEPIQNKWRPQRLKRLFFKIDELVRYRNLVAHGVVPDDILSKDILLEYIKFVHAYCEGLYESIFQLLLEHEINKCDKLITFGAPIEVYHNKVVCFEMNTGNLSVGDMLIAKTKDKIVPYRFSKILRMEVDNEKHDSLTIDTKTQVGIEVEFIAKKAYRYFLLPGFSM